MICSVRIHRVIKDRTLNHNAFYSGRGIQEAPGDVARASVLNQPDGPGIGERDGHGGEGLIDDVECGVVENVDRNDNIIYVSI